MDELITKVSAQLQTVQDNIVTIGEAIIIIAAVVLGIRWIKAQFF